jgi:hypothetical protein
VTLDERAATCTFTKSDRVKINAAARIVFDCRTANDPAMMPTTEMKLRPIQYAAGSLAGSAFIATTQILTGVTLDLPLYVALVAFAINIPFQIMIFFMPIPLTIKEVQRLRAESQRLSWQPWLYFSIHLFSTPFIIIGFAALFWHFACWLGVLFALAACTAYRILRDSAMEDFKQRPEEYK